MSTSAPSPPTLRRSKGLDLIFSRKRRRAAVAGHRDGTASIGESSRVPPIEPAQAAADQAGRKRIKVFLERHVSGEYLLELSYETLLGIGADTAEPIAVPLLSAGQVHRQRGMVALLSGTELALEPAPRPTVAAPRPGRSARSPGSQARWHPDARPATS